MAECLNENFRRYSFVLHFFNSGRIIENVTGTRCTRLSSVNRAAHLFECFYASRAVEICEEEGISDDEIDLGAKWADARREVRAMARRVYGDPAYGAWPEEAGEWVREQLCRRGIPSSDRLESAPFVVKDVPA